MPFPPLPLHDTPWPPIIYEAFQSLKDRYDRAASTLARSAVDVPRILFHKQVIEDEVVTLFNALEGQIQGEDVPDNLRAWLQQAINSFANLLVQVYEAEASGTGQDSVRTIQANPVAIRCIGRRGRPRKTIDQRLLHEAMAPHRAVSKSALARHLKIARGTLLERLAEEDITTGFSGIEDDELDVLTREFRKRYPDSGISSQSRASSSRTAVPARTKSTSQHEEILSTDDEGPISTTNSSGNLKQQSKSGSNSAVAAFADVVNKWRSSSASGSIQGAVTGISSSSTSKFLQAKQETSSGLRTVSWSKRPAAPKGKGKAKSKKTENDSSGDDGDRNAVYRVGAVVMLPHGVTPIASDDERNDVSGIVLTHYIPLPYNKVPNIAQLQSLRRQKLAIIDHVNGIEFRRDEDFHQLASRLQGYLPQPFTYFDTEPAELTTGSSDDHFFKSPFLLCTRIRTRLCVAPGVEYPTGADVELNTKITARGFKDHMLIIASRNPIPNDILRSWTPGSDSHITASTSSSTQLDIDSSPPFSLPNPITMDNNHSPQIQAPTQGESTSSLKQTLKRKAVALLDEMDDFSTDSVSETDLPPPKKRYRTRSSTVDVSPGADSDTNPIPELPSFTIDESLADTWAHAPVLDFD
ncbi:hypothetical protein CCMSSC00406_0009540 [Pleurotus cornucopiae]|uniref:Uncharacterized protein n=1 Tax=Pleurotus cornucopiae TaxID=5321 RepID=A0ACB7IR33_PLECO|nr:hypothetical protein CCMSSC00406_0009540 [Pleurotus cornucopiae]